MKLQAIVTQCVLIVLLAVAVIFTFAVPDDSLHCTAWWVFLLLSKAVGILLFAFILNPKAPWSARNT